MDNRLTVEGTRMHRRADSGNDETRSNRVVLRGLPVRSPKMVGRRGLWVWLGLIGRRAKRPDVGVRELRLLSCGTLAR